MSFGDTFSDFISYDSKKSKITAEPTSGGGYNFTPAILVVLFALAFLILIGRLLILQIFQGKYYHSLSANNRIRTTPIHAPRGSIFDRNGVLLAGSEGAVRLRQCDANGDCSARVLSRQESLKIEAEGGLSKNSVLEVDSQRFYPKGEAFGSLLGYVSEINQDELKKKMDYSLGDRVGRGGLEQQYESILKGVDGKELIETDAAGNKIRSLGSEAPKSGQNITLTLDVTLQNVAYEALGSRKGAVVVSRPATGEILALVSSPSFDPNAFTQLTMDKSERETKVESILNDKNNPLFDRAVSATYPPGSTFKLISATAGLETGKITEQTTIDDPGILVIGPYKFPNWKWLQDGGVQGVLNVVGALQKSNDIFFYRVGEWVGEEELFAWAKRFGLGAPLGIDLPSEAAGLVPEKYWRQKNSRSWYLGDTYHSAIGQGDLLVTPIQDNFFTNVIANNGKLCRPHLVDKSSESDNTKENCKDLGIKKNTIGLVQKGMAAACNEGGTAYPLFGFAVDKTHSNPDATASGQPERIPIQLACKTGTAEYGDLGKRTHAWLTLFAPLNNPEISVTAIIEGAGEGSDEAAPVVKKVLEEWFGR